VVEGRRGKGHGPPFQLFGLLGIDQEGPGRRGRGDGDANLGLGGTTRGRLGRQGQAAGRRPGGAALYGKRENGTKPDAKTSSGPGLGLGNAWGTDGTDAGAAKGQGTPGPAGTAFQGCPARGW
jgi:hypothetical protein